MRKIISFIAAVALAVSCIYPYEAEIEGKGGNLVIEGDITLGSISTFALSYLIPLNETSVDGVPHGELWVEDTAGNKYPGVATGVAGEYEVDTRLADKSLEHRLYLRTTNGKEYYSDWGKATGSCEVYDIKCTPKVNHSGATYGADFTMSLKSQDAKHFRYRYKEDWEFTSVYRSQFSYDPTTDEENPYGFLIPISTNDANYFCWKSDKSRGINLATTENMSVDHLDDYPLFTYDENNRKLEYIYRIEVEVYPVSEDSYRYYEHIKEVSNYNGSLFAPIPSEIRGNIHCAGDEDEFVYGYIATSVPSSCRSYFRDDEIHVYKHPNKSTWGYEAVPAEQWAKYYFVKNWLPVNFDMVANAYYWAEARCVNCLLMGGTKNKPADWPNDHK